MDNHDHHENLMEAVAGQFKDILDNSKQAIYIYLDDTHKICNKKFSDFLEYASPEEWSKVNMPFTDAFVAQKSQSAIVSAFQLAMTDMTASEKIITWKKKSGLEVEATVTLVPITYDNHLMALHFISV